MIKQGHKTQLSEAMNEILDLTCEVVDIGTWIITQVRTLGALSDDTETCKDIVTACLAVERAMLGVNSNWESVEEIKTKDQQQQEEDERMIPMAIERSREIPKEKDLVDEINEIEKWLHRTQTTFQKNPNLASDLIKDTKGQRLALSKVISYIDVEPQYYHLTARTTNLMKNIESFLRLLENNQNGHSRFNQFMTASDLLINQLDSIANELKNATIAIAGELAPLARTKCKALLDFGNDLIKKHIEVDIVQKRGNDLQRKLSQIELMADRIILGQQNSVKSALDRIQTWCAVQDDFLLKNSNMGNDAASAGKFLAIYEKLSREVISKQQELYALTSQVSDAQIQDKYNQSYRLLENLTRSVENRLRLANTFNQVQKFSRELDGSFNSLSNLLKSNKDFSDAKVANQMVNVFHMIQETLGQERHQAQKFIAAITEVEDETLDKEAAIEAASVIQEVHSQRLSEIGEQWQNWQMERTKIVDSVSKVESIQCWQEETIELIRTLEHRMDNVRNEEETQMIETTLRRLEDIVPAGSQQVKSIQEVKSQKVYDILRNQEMIERKKEELSKKHHGRPQTTQFHTIQQEKLTATRQVPPTYRTEVSEVQETVDVQTEQPPPPQQKTVTEQSQTTYRQEQKVQEEREEICREQETEKQRQEEIRKDYGQEESVSESVTEIREWQQETTAKIECIKSEIATITTDSQVALIEEGVKTIERALPLLSQKIATIKSPEVREVVERQQEMVSDLTCVKKDFHIAKQRYQIRKQVDVEQEEMIEEIVSWQQETNKQVEMVKEELASIKNEGQMAVIENVITKIEKALPIIKKQIATIIQQAPYQTAKLINVMQDQQQIEEQISIVRRDFYYENERQKECKQVEEQEREVIEEVTQWQTELVTKIEALKVEVSLLRTTVQVAKAEEVIASIDRAMPIIKKRLGVLIEQSPIQTAQLVLNFQRQIEETFSTIKEDFYAARERVSAEPETTDITKSTEEVEKLQSETLKKIEMFMDELSVIKTEVQAAQVEEIVAKIGRALPIIRKRLATITAQSPLKSAVLIEMEKKQVYIEEQATTLTERFNIVKDKVIKEQKKEVGELVEWQKCTETQIAQLRDEMSTITTDVQAAKIEEVFGQIQRAFPMIKKRIATVIQQTSVQSAHLVDLIKKQKVIEEESLFCIREIINLRRSLPDEGVVRERKKVTEEIEEWQVETKKALDMVASEISILKTPIQVSKIENIIYKIESSLPLIKHKLAALIEQSPLQHAEMIDLVRKQKVIEEQTLLVKEEFFTICQALPSHVSSEHKKMREEITVWQSDSRMKMIEAKNKLTRITTETEVAEVEDVIAKIEKAIPIVKSKVTIIAAEPSPITKQLLNTQRIIEEEVLIIKEEIQNIRVAFESDQLKRTIEEVSRWQVDSLTILEDLKSKLFKRDVVVDEKNVESVISNIETTVPYIKRQIGKITEIERVAKVPEVASIVKRQKVIEDEVVIIKEEFETIKKATMTTEEITIWQVDTLERIENIKNRLFKISSNEDINEFGSKIEKVETSVVQMRPSISSYISKIDAKTPKEIEIVNRQRVIEEETIILKDEFEKIRYKVRSTSESASDHKKHVEEITMMQVDVLERIRTIKDAIPTIQTEEVAIQVEEDVVKVENAVPLIKHKIDAISNQTVRPSSKPINLIMRQNIIEEETLLIRDQIDKILQQFNPTRVTVDEVFIVESMEEQIAIRPRIVTPLMDMITQEGTKVNIMATLSGGQPETIKWKKDGKELKGNDKIKMTCKNGVATMTIEEVFIEDAACYTLLVSNTSGADESSATVVVVPIKSSKEPSPEPCKPYFKKQLTTTTVEEGETIVLDCVIFAKPEPTVLWHKSTKEEEETLIVEDDRTTLRYVEDHCTLTIKNSKVEDSSLYKCTATNINGESVNFCKVNVRKSTKQKSTPPATLPKPKTFVLPSPPAFIPSLTNVHAIEGSSAEFKVKICAEPTPTVVWTFNGQPLVQTKNVRILNEEEGWSRVVIEKVVSDVVGLYTVKATNSLGEAHSGGTLSMKSNEDNISRDFTDEEYAFQSKSTDLISRSKQFLQDHGGYYTDGGFTATPTPPPVPQHRINQSITEDFMEVEHHEIGLSPTATYPQFVKPFPNEFTFNEGESSRLECVLIGSPRPKVEWYFNESRIISNPNNIEFVNRGDTYAIQIKQPKFEHSGYYKICAVNVKGSTESTVVIHIRPRSMIPTPTRSSQRPAFWREHTSSQDKGGELYRNVLKSSDSFSRHDSKSEQETVSLKKSKLEGQPPHFSTTLSSAITTIGEGVVFKGNVNSYPGCDIVWTKNGVDMKFEENRIIPSFNNGEVKLTFTSTSIEDSATYVCKATNSLGLATSSAQLVVRPKTLPPDFLKRLISEEAVSGESLEWNIKVIGDPFPSVKISLNGKELISGQNGFFVRKGENGCYKILIPILDQSHAGQYAVILENTVGESSSCCDLVVRSSDQAPGSYFHFTKVTEGTKIGDNEITKNKVFSIESPKTTANERSLY
uniref:Titin n=1 Tax=Rhabditophanes sp. KR3021 TaxID=114890 RepID=A0AC35U231_9BILA